MAWIRTIEPRDATGELAELLGPWTDPDTGRTDNILTIHSLHPAGLRAHLGLYRAVMTGTPGLPKVDREMIALAVSQENGCHY